ncbi:MAG: peptidylprolyl isomerase [Beijerinckiaceae bacterium]|nr:peptidylprolyl isomerase [Beijerinckiaceae bacterium]
MTIRAPLASCVILAAAAFMLGAIIPTHADARTVARVDGADITDDDVKLAAEDIGSDIPPQLEGPERQAYVVDYLIDMRLAARKAEADKLSESADFTRRLAYLRDKALMEGLLTKIARESNNDANVQQVYAEASKGQGGEQEVRARHILVENEALARAALKRVQSGEDFAKVADQVSKDPGSRGGELGWFTKDRMVPEFAEAAFKMQPGQISQPVKSQFGWHIIKVEERREKPFPKLEEVRDQVERFVVQKAQAEAVGKLRESAKIEKLDEPAPAAPLAAPAAPR